MSDSKNVSMKLLIDTKGKRVLFAEAGKDCVDFLFHILSLPVATIISLLKARGMVGSLPNLYKSLDALSDTYIQPDQKKDAYLKPVSPLSSSSFPLLPLTGGAQLEKKYHSCSSCNKYVSDDPRTTCPRCLCKLSVKMTYVAPLAVEAASGEGGLVKGVVTYMVIKPMSTISSITMLNKFNVKEVGALEEKMVNLGMNEAIKLLKTSLQSNKVLTDVFF